MRRTVILKCANVVPSLAWPAGLAVGLARCATQPSGCDSPQGTWVPRFRALDGVGPELGGADPIRQKEPASRHQNGRSKRARADPVRNAAVAAGAFVEVAADESPGRLCVVAGAGCGSAGFGGGAG